MALDNAYIRRSYATSSLDEMRSTYDEWAEQYDTHMVEEQYVAPRLCAAATAQHGQISGNILDAGCGSGIVGFELKKLGAKVVDGIDLSEGMLKVAARNGAYRNLDLADLSEDINKPDNSYEAVVCVGTLTNGHVGPVPSLREFARITKPNGIIVATILPQLWEAKGFEAEVDRLIKQGQVELVSKDVNPYRRGQDARIVILKAL
ncbi:S-adenosyl-L-methionine-dependent methyltransferase [Aaosphaeria arxii CBS 175.79]|uniref:S-adenosyl-L-methionine-dependent methyltransferase n=1 Tax=Aaosphaeria arxii CBS 175.79 TaxID=1450172 RepID=A0A6A5Y921_9PLEO|nr:S-adenosyl-L-methionine-dependent methyltransferase [Aaosphaeria arxii CBS 175.79]KAF2021507.1 S-adenosyl-L-methionine-dependent methyltransferase [Aaosphaeria arxii CBS 175.79]